MYSDFAVNKYLHTVASGWIFINTYTHTHTYIYIYIYKKIKLSRYRPDMAQRVGRGMALLFHDCGTRKG